MRPSFRHKFQAATSILLSALPSWRVVILFAIVIGLIWGASLYMAAQHTVNLIINGTAFSYRTHQTSPQRVLRETGFIPRDGDGVYYPSKEELLRGEPIRVTCARQVVLIHDGSMTEAQTQTGNVAGALAALGVPVSVHDHLLLEGDPCSRQTELPAPKEPKRHSVKAWVAAIRKPIKLAVRRAVSLHVQDGSIPLAFHTTARTVGEALFERDIHIYEGDKVFPSLDTEMTPGLTVFIQRSKPITLNVGGTMRMVRTRSATVQKLLDAEGIDLAPKDYVLPAAETAIERNMHVAVTRVQEQYHIEEIPIPFETVWEADPNMEIDQRQVAHWGQEGAKRSRVLVHYENGKETHRHQDKEWIARAPIDRTIKYGTKIVIRKLETPHGTIEYWRQLRMLATSYNAPTAGKPPTHPLYGITRSGMPARKGLVAVDPRVINLHQKVYVPDYGVGLAADTGSAIKWRHVDLCFDDNNLELWYRWVDVYVLTPVPPKKEITWIIPDYPKERA
ncbi:MAG: ubiquitin-like domain-containing protein [Chloroflexota bacterium]|nr:ubiquitin-like domain-containing protein [Chloroflexota bacterium]